MTVPLHAHKVTARNDGRHIVPLTIVEQKFKFRIELHPCAFESGGDEFQVSRPICDIQIVNLP